MVVCDCMLSVMIARVYHEVRYRSLGMQSVGLWDLRKCNLKEKGIAWTIRYSTDYKGRFSV